jgi:hypothetical protein
VNGIMINCIILNNVYILFLLNITFMSQLNPTEVTQYPFHLFLGQLSQIEVNSGDNAESQRCA